MRDKHMYNKLTNDRLKTAGESISTPDQEKLLNYLFLCFAYELKQDRDKMIFQEPVWSDPETTFSIVLYRSGGVSHDYCCSCIEILGGLWQRECGPVTTIYTESREERDELKNRFISLHDQAKKSLIVLKNRTPQEYYALKTSPVIKEVLSTDCNHIVAMQAYFHDSVDVLAWEETLQPWADYERIRDHFKIVFDDDGMAEVLVAFYRLKKQKRFIHFLKGLGVECQK